MREGLHNTNNPDRGADTVTIAEAAALLGVHPNTIRNRVKEGLYKAEKVLTERGPTWFIERDSLVDNTSTTFSQQNVSELDVQGVPDLLTNLVNQLGEAQQGAQAKEERDRLRQSGIEFWKATSDLFKHIMTLSLAALAAFGALLGGVFSDPGTWDGYLFEDMLFMPRNLIIPVTFLSFLLAALGSAFVISRSRYTIWHMGEIETAEGLSEFQHREIRLFSRYSREVFLAILPFGLGILGFEVFVLNSF